MDQTAHFSYEQFWEEHESDPRPRPVVAEDGWVDAIELEEASPPWVRPTSRRDPFPPCQALRAWPRNYPVGELADLSDDEEAEVDPERFVFSDGEMEAWAQIVGSVLDDERVFALVGSSFGRAVKEDPPQGQLEVHEMTQMSQRETGGRGERAPPVWKIAAGGVQLAVWRNPAPGGGAFHSATLERHFKDKDGKWAKSPSLRLNDIPKAVLVLQKAYEWLAMEARTEVEEGGEAPFSPATPQAVPESIPQYLASLRPDIFGPDALVKATSVPGRAVLG